MVGGVKVDQKSLRQEVISTSRENGKTAKFVRHFHSFPGGWQWSQPFSTKLSPPQSKQQMTKSCRHLACSWKRASSHRLLEAWRPQHKVRIIFCWVCSKGRWASGDKNSNSLKGMTFSSTRQQRRWSLNCLHDGCVLLNSSFPTDRQVKRATTTERQPPLLHSTIFHIVRYPGHTFAPILSSSSLCICPSTFSEPPPPISY